jgi:hypothetical protein
MTVLVPTPEHLAPRMRTTRGEHVAPDAEPAALRGVPTRAFDQAVEQSRDGFPVDYLFRFGPTRALSRYAFALIERSLGRCV